MGKMETEFLAAFVPDPERERGSVFQPWTEPAPCSARHRAGLRFRS